MTLVLSNNDVQRALDIKECLDVMEESYRELAASRAVNRPTCHSYLPHSLPNSTYSFKSVDGGIGKYGVLALRVTSDVVQEQQIRGTVRLEKLPLAGKSLESIERAAIAQTLEHCGGNKTKAARVLGISPSTLYEKVKKYSL